jgi:flavin reductase (DIM6/NTAB) family NADH-FMN oxidoreductase RutF
MSEKIKMEYTDHFARVMKIMSSRGVLLATWKDPGKKANAMTIGWGMIGSVWSRPIWQVVVRPSRYTYTLLETERFFSVNVLPKSMNSALTACGTVSGRDRDKLADARLTVSAGAAVGAPIINESIITYECHVVHANDFIPEAMIPDIRAGCYPSGDYHRIFWGQIMDCRVDAARLGELD